MARAWDFARDQALIPGAIPGSVPRPPPHAQPRTRSPSRGRCPEEPPPRFQPRTRSPSRGRRPEEPPAGRVAIIGAGMAGLTFARAVQAAGRGEVEVLVFDQCEELDAPVISGDIRVPDARAVLSRLGVGGDAVAALCDAARTRDGSHLPQQGLLLLLARSLVPGTLRLGCQVSAVRRAAAGRGLLCCLPDGETAGPFSLVVCAHGQLPTVLMPSAAADASDMDPPPLAVVGDARWVRQRRWDLGTARRARGANMALLEGLELGEMVGSAFGDCPRRHGIVLYTDSMHGVVFCFILHAAVAISLLTRGSLLNIRRALQI